MAIAYQKAGEALARIRKHRKTCLIIHYACQSLFDDKDGHSPRIANIVVKNYDNDQTSGFALHLMAEKLGVSKADLTSKLDEVETRLLEEFYDFVRAHPGNIWVHWNMKDLVFGFETLAHRYSVLTGKNAPSIDIDSRINLAAILIGRFGSKYVGVPHIPKLMELNGGVRRDFVPGADEVELFERGEFARLHSSTVSKVAFFKDVIDLVLDRKLKVARRTIYAHFERALDHALAKAIGLAASAYALFEIFKKLAERWPS